MADMKISIAGTVAMFTNETAEAPWTVAGNQPLEDELNALFSWAESSPGEPHIVEQAAKYYKADILVGPEPLVEGVTY